MDQPKYDIAIAGGGLAGLSLSILAARAGHSVVLFEKNTYPYHKVCGEYISMESFNFLVSLGLDLQAMQLPVIDTLNLSSPSGKILTEKLQPGGFGISRYKLDHALSLIAIDSGVKLFEATKVEDIIFQGKDFEVKTSRGNFVARVAVAAYGKRSNLDVKWNRDFLKKKSGAKNNLVGIKYHVLFHQRPGQISLHNFKGGYCGISAIEDGRSCLCYLVTASALKRCGNSIPKLEQEILSRNPHLKKIFTEAEFCFKIPVTISQISFEKKPAIEDHVLMTGDSAGMITPLCGNGMSMALHSAKLCFQQVDKFLNDRITRKEMEEAYQSSWEKTFSKRLALGRLLQNFFGKAFLNESFLFLLRPFSFIRKWLISKSHGEEF